MPHAELKYSADMDLDAPHLLQVIEAVINEHDPKAGACKGRAYPTSHFHHTHLLVSVTMLTKPHRDRAFIDRLIADLETRIKAHVRTSCHFSLSLALSDENYVTNWHESG